MIFSANYLGVDEDKGAIDGEQVLDRICVIPFVEWGDMSIDDFTRMQKDFKDVVDNDEKPTEYLIGEIGDYLRTDEYKEVKKEMSQFLYSTSEETVKIRTFDTNYAPFYAIVKKFSEDFSEVWDEMGLSFDGFLEWAKDVHVPFLKKQHQEKDHSTNSIRRYILEVLNFTVDWSILDRKKILKICETKKLKNGEKYCLAFHPSSRYVDFQEMGGIKLKDLKSHAVASGGAWGEDTYAAMLRDNVEVLNETDDTSVVEDTVAKRAILIPLKVFNSSHIMKIASMTGQSEDYKRFGVDEETPSGVLDIRNSTQRSGSSSNLVLSDISRIGDRHENDDIAFDVIERPEETNFIDEFTLARSSTTDNETRTNNSIERNDDDDDDDDDDGEQNANENQDNVEDDFIFHQKPNLSRSLKSTSRNVTVISSNEKTFFVCNCGFSSTSQSGSSRHKCRHSNDVQLSCDVCGQKCKNAGSLKRHKNAKHGASSTLESCGQSSMNDVPVPSQTDSLQDSSKVSALIDESGRIPCSVCGKTLKTKKTLSKHMMTHARGSQAQNKRSSSASQKE